MGMGSADASIIARLRRDGYLAGDRRVVEIGAQQMGASMLSDSHWREECASAFGVPSREFSGETNSSFVHGDLAALAANAPPTRDLWQWLGFDYSAIDVDGSPDAVPLDLNFAETPINMIGKATLVTNYGTTEHVANQVNAFKIIHELTSEGGVMIHNLPAQGYMVHGLVNYNLKFFWCLSAANAYKWLFADVIQSGVKYAISPDILGEIARLNPSAVERISNYRFSDAGIVVVMQKLYDFPFVPPIDVPTGTKTDIQELKQRYWTIFESDRFFAQIAEIEAQRTAAREAT